MKLKKLSEQEYNQAISNLARQLLLSGKKTILVYEEIMFVRIKRGEKNVGAV